MIKEPAIVHHQIALCSILHLLLHLVCLCLLADMIRELAGLSRLPGLSVLFLLKLNLEDPLQLGAGIRVLKFHLTDNLAKRLILR